MTAGRRLAGGLVAASLLVACGGEDRELGGYRRDPAPAVDEVALPDVAAGGDGFALRAPDDGVLVVYFGYTNCPDVCPTTLATVRGALSDLDDGAERVGLAMVTVDPDRDTDVLAEYVQGFVPSARALATNRDADLQRVAERFGVAYRVTPRPNGDVEVAHTDNLFAVDDTGTLVLTWPSGVSRDDLAADLEQLLEEAGDP